MTFYEPLLGILLNGWVTSYGHYHAYYINLVFLVLGWSEAASRAAGGEPRIESKSWNCANNCKPTVAHPPGGASFLLQSLGLQCASRHATHSVCVCACVRACVVQARCHRCSLQLAPVLLPKIHGFSIVWCCEIIAPGMCPGGQRGSCLHTQVGPWEGIWTVGQWHAPSAVYVPSRV